METLSENNKDLFRLYFQRNSDYYIEQMEGFEQNGKYTFSVKAFFLGIFWMSYRKMYKTILIIVAIILAQSFLEEAMLTYGVMSESTYLIIDKISMLIWGFVIGSISNKLYISKCKKDINKILSHHSNEEGINEEIKRKGGVNWAAPFVLLVLLLLAVLMSM
jgi:hypothetical protein